MTQREQLRTIAVRAMHERGLEPDIPADALAEADRVARAPETTPETTRDLRSLLWCSIDNDDSKDLDQLSVAEPLDGGRVRIRVAIADVDSLVAIGSAIDRHAAANTTSVYTPAAIFPMLPERLSTDLTSLADQQERVSIVVDYVVSPDGTVDDADVYGARVKNWSKLAYNAVGAWFEGGGPLPPAAATVRGMDEQLRIQDRVAQALSAERHRRGALEFASDDVEHVFEDGALREVKAAAAPNRAKQLIENLMVAANGVVARFLDARGLPSVRRVVRSPERWDRIRGLAAEFGETLPDTADPVALAQFLTRRRQAAPDDFAELSHRVIKMIGSGEYVVDPPGAEPPGHFGLAVRDYTHSTAPNRRYPDLITQRLIKAAIGRRPAPYATDALDRLAAHCTTQEDAANKVERQVRKSAAAMVVQQYIGQIFDAHVTGASPKGTFVRVLTPPIEGMLVRGGTGLDVGDRVRARLVRVDVDRGFIDFEAR
jgi:exoribonuclease-2